MKALVVEDDFITSQVMKEILLSFGECDVAENGVEAIQYFSESYTHDDPYSIIFLDIMMPEIDGQETLERIRAIENQNGVYGLDSVKIVMTTALDDFDNIKVAFKNQCEGYIVKPINKDKIINILLRLEILE